MGWPLAPSIIVFIVPSIAAGLGVQQLPPMASVPAGDSITLSCTFHSRNQTGTQVTWARGFREAVVLDPAHPFYQGRLAQSQRDQQGQAEATVTLSELMERDSGLYHCYITYPRGEQGKGTGTSLTVLGRAVAEIPAGCKRALAPNLGASGQKPEAPGGRELCRDSGPLFYRAVTSLSLVVLFSLGIILSLRPWNGTGSTRVPPSLPVPNGYVASLRMLVTSPCPTPEPAASQHCARDPHVTSPCPTPEPAASQHQARCPCTTSPCTPP
ncbi:uncharacterized protein ACDP82_015719 isoform 7-T8 [Pangshura tecta]